VFIIASCEPLGVQLSKRADAGKAVSAILTDIQFAFFSWVRSMRL